MNLRYLIHILLATLAINDVKSEFCPKVYHKGVLELDINPAFLNADKYNTNHGRKKDGLTISSFFNHAFTYNQGAGEYVPNFPPFAPDQVGRIPKITDMEPDDFDFETDYEKLTGQEITWPNNARRTPDGMLPFEGVIIPQGFHPIPTAGRLTIINLDDKDLLEYVVHEGSIDLDPPVLEGPNDMPKFFHNVLFHDMDGDKKLDIVTVRSGFKVLQGQTGPPTVYPPHSELVYYKNPGKDIDPEVEWEEKILYGGPFAVPPFMGPDIHLAMHDFDGDGVPEIVATHFFTGDDPSLPQPTKGKIVMYGAPFKGSWKEINGTDPSAQPRIKLINDSQGFPFDVDIVDLNGDGKMEILATNHQPNCLLFPGIPGQVYAVEQPASGKVFEDDWTLRVLLDGILPQPTPDSARGRRLAPGHVIPFYPKEEQIKRGERPWILVSGDEAGKVWMMKPIGREFEYETAIVLDINDYYGNQTTQTFTRDGFTVSTIGEPALFYDGIDTDGRKEKSSSGTMSKQMKHGHLKGTKVTSRSSKSSKSMNSSRNQGPRGNKSKKSKSKGSKRGLKVLKRTGFLRHETRSESSRFAKIYIPVFEAKEIHILSFEGDDETKRIQCPADITYGCPLRR